MNKSLVEKFYALIFADEGDEKQVPYANKVFMFWFSLIAFLVVAVLIGLDIAENISQNL